MEFAGCCRGDDGDIREMAKRSWGRSTLCLECTGMLQGQVFWRSRSQGNLHLLWDIHWPTKAAPVSGETKSCSRTWQVWCVLAFVGTGKGIFAGTGVATSPRAAGEGREVTRDRDTLPRQPATGAALPHGFADQGAPFLGSWERYTQGQANSLFPAGSALSCLQFHLSEPQKRSLKATVCGLAAP